MEKCSFCGKSIRSNQIRKLIRSPIMENVFICDQCHSIVDRLIYEENTTEKEEEEAVSPIEGMTPSMIRNELDKYIIGQEQAKKVLSVSIYNHYKRINDTTGTIKKSNILLAGPSGSGKTHIVKTMASLLGLPLVIVSATSMTESGYVGDDVEVCLQQLLELTNGDIKKAQQGIVFIDEVDKISRKSASPSISRDVSGEGVQAALLKIIEGSIVSVPTTGRRKNPSKPTVEFDTKDVLFIAGGAFEGLFQKEEVVHRSIGFNSSPSEHITTPAPEKLTPDVLISYGMMREFIGRFPSLVLLDQLTENDLVRILCEPEDAITKEYKMLLDKDNIELIFQEDYLKEVARCAMERNIGARGLRSIIEDTMMDIMYHIPDEKNASRCILTKDSITTKQGIIEVKKKRKTG